jgi:glycosyltransferase involved in cell wall biosynthesis
LVKALDREKISYWYDEAEIQVGDSVPAKISNGLTTSRYVVVVLSSTFIKKAYAQEELNSALHSQASSGEVKVIPVLVGSEENHKEIFTRFPLLSSRSYIVWDGKPDTVVNALLRRLRPGSRVVSRICFVSSEYPPLVSGGLGVHVNQLTLALSEHVDIDIVLANPGRFGYQNLSSRIRLISLTTKPPSYAEPISWLQFANDAADRIMRTAREFRPDVIHCHDWVTVLAGIVCRWRLNIPLVFHLHLPNRNQLCASVENLGLVCADLVTVNSEFMYGELKRRQLANYFLPLKRVEVVKNGVDTDRFVPSADWPADDGYVLFVGRLVEQKGVEYLLRAFYYVRVKFPHIRLRIVGKGEFKPMLERLCTNLILSGEVEFIEWTTGEDLVRHYQRAQIVVIPSVYEPFGMTALEALACQRPVVASRVGGLQEIIEHQVTGFLADPKDELDLARWIMTLLANSELRNQMGKAGRNVVLSQGYTWPQIAGRFVDLYKEILQKPLDRNIPGEVAILRSQIEDVAKRTGPDLSRSVLDRLFYWEPWS